MEQDPPTAPAPSAPVVRPGMRGAGMKIDAHPGSPSRARLGVGSWSWELVELRTT